MSLRLFDEVQRSFVPFTSAVAMMRFKHHFLFYNEAELWLVLLFSLLPNQDTVFPQLTNSTQLRYAYSSVLTVTMASDQSFYEAFRQAQISREVRAAVAATEVHNIHNCNYTPHKDTLQMC